jgi:ferredoxin
VFVDFWNFQLSWNAAMDPARCDWRGLPSALVGAAARLLADVGITDPLELEETLLYASVDPVADANLRAWLTGTIARMPSWRLPPIRERKPQPKSLHCRNCGQTTSACPACAQAFFVRPEKGVDAAMVTDMLSLAWQDAYEVAILVSNDADFVPAVERVQERGVKVVNASWAGKGYDLKRACWASFDLNTITHDICR